MSYDFTVTKGYGFTVPLTDFPSDFDRIEAQLRRSHRGIKIGMSGSSTINASLGDDDVIWVAPARLVQAEEPSYSEGFAWNFRDEPTDAEREALGKIAIELFGLPDVPPIEPFVVLEVL